MIIVDFRKGGTTEDIPQQFVGQLKSLGLKAEKGDLQYGDFAFDGNGPDGPIGIGVERKTLHDLLNCIDDSRYNMQRIGMKNCYNVSALMVEGHWKPHDPRGLLMEGFNGGTSWSYCRYRSQQTLYAKVYRYLTSVALSGVLVSYSRDVFHTAYNVHELYHYFQKRWGDHTSLLETQKLNIPSLNIKPNLTRLWATDLTDVGVKTSMLAERQFKTPLALANADEVEWLKIPGIGVKTAQQIVREIWTGKR